jgi:cysteinyl-tRNA synthetase
MAEIRLYNTLTRNVEALAPRQPPQVGIYCCGPTVYDVPHAGHARAAVAFDVLVRHLRARGFEVTYVRNVTDIDDKILQRAKQNGEQPLALSRRMADVYAEQIAAIGCVAPDHAPRVSDHMPQIFELITKLVEHGAAYVQEMPGGTRDVYFSVRSFPGYGKLSRRKIDELISGARVEKDETKRDPIDFALWKGAPPEEWGWDSPWGWGRPGWHIECSAMSERYLGHGFDIHAGGMDLIFPHHENEIAQSEAAAPGAGPFARCWMHNGFVNVDKEKMSKSLGNFVTVSDVLERNDPEGFRYFLIGVHYRGPIQFDTEQLADDRVVFPGVDEGERRTDYLFTTVERLSTLAQNTDPAPAKSPPEVANFVAACEQALAAGQAALDDDLNTPVALAALGELAKQANELADLAHKRRKDAGFVAASAAAARKIGEQLRALASELGLLACSSEQYFARTRARRLRLRGLSAESIEALVAERMAARVTKEFARADALRAELTEKGIVLQDGPAGTSWSVVP